jgi:hypothetical protein
LIADGLVLDAAGKRDMVGGADGRRQIAAENPGGLVFTLEA